MSAWFSLPQQWLMTTWKKQTSTILVPSQCYRSKNKIPRALKRFVCKLLWFLLWRRFCRQNWCYAQLYTLRSPDIFFITMPQEASLRRSRTCHEIPGIVHIPAVLPVCDAGYKKPERENLEVEQPCRPASGPCECLLPTNKWKTEGQNAHSSWL